MRKRFANPYLLLTLAMLFWSSNMVLSRAFRAELPPLTLAFWRWIVALCCTLPFALPHLRGQWPLLLRGWRPLLALGTLGIAGYNTFAYLGLQQTTATNALLLNSFIPIATVAISWAALGKRLRPLQTTGVLVSLCGALTIVGRGSVATLVGFQLNVGDLWVLLAVLDWAIYTIALAWRPPGVHPMPMLAAMLVIGIVALAPVYAWDVGLGRHATWNLASVAAVAYIGVFPGFIGYVFYNRGVAAVGASKGSLFVHLMPVFGTLLAAVFLGEVPQWFHYLGIVLIFAGIGMTTRR